MFSLEELLGTFILGCLVGITFIVVWSAILMGDEKEY